MTKKIILSLILCFTAITISACNNSEQIEPYAFSNADFETGTLSGWDINGDAFRNSSVEFALKDSSGYYFNQQGDFFLFGGYGDRGNLKGYLESELFELRGNGIIGFLIGAGENTELTYVSIIDQKGQEVGRSGNINFNGTNQMSRVEIDVSSHIGEKLRVKIIDEDDTNSEFNYINVDDFIINYQRSISVSKQLKEANEYVASNLDKINSQYRLTYHAMSELNWANDPNGLIWYNGEFHMFYQHNPYASTWGPMHWGHLTSTDLVQWENQPIALAPDQVYDAQFGAFSGTAIEIDGKLYLIYTSSSNNKQQQAIAISSDGIIFEKQPSNPVISSSEVPLGASISDFRDPDVFRIGNYYYVIIGTRMNGYGQLVLYRSIDMVNFEYIGPLMNNSNSSSPNFFQLNGVYECPSFATIDGQQILIVSPQNLEQNGTMFENVHSVVYMIGQLNLETGKFSYDDFHEIDSGFDFYAAQMAELPDGRTIMIAWMQMWDRTLPTQNHQWVGAYTLPRELSIIDGILYQKPIRELENYRSMPYHYENISLTPFQDVILEGVQGKTIELEMEFDVQTAKQVGIELFKGTDHATKVYYDQPSQTVVIDRSNSGIQIFGVENNMNTRSASVSLDGNILKLHIFLDVSSIEVFINDGISTLTANVYPDLEDIGISFYVNGGNAKLLSLNKYTLSIGGS